jgi:DNA-binding XRE family transcriptional regulator
VIYHLWHPTAMRRGSREYQANQRRFAAYRAARRTREDMAALVGLSAQAVS